MHKLYFKESTGLNLNGNKEPHNLIYFPVTSPLGVTYFFKRKT